MRALIILLGMFSSSILGERPRPSMINSLGNFVSQVTDYPVRTEAPKETPTLPVDLSYKHELESLLAQIDAIIVSYPNKAENLFVIRNDILKEFEREAAFVDSMRLMRNNNTSYNRFNNDNSNHTMNDKVIPSYRNSNLSVEETEVPILSVGAPLHNIGRQDTQGGFLPTNLINGDALNNLGAKSAASVFGFQLGNEKGEPTLLSQL